MSDVTPADLRANPWRVAVTGDGERVRYHEEMGHQFEHNGDWLMMCGTFMDSLDWPAEVGGSMSTNESETEMTGTHEWPTVGNGCECWVNPNPWTYYGIPEPGDCTEYNPDCPEHGKDTQ